MLSTETATLPPRSGHKAITESLTHMRKTFEFCRLIGGQGVNRTLDTKIFSLLLYRLSYLPTGTASVRPSRRS
jgi:hypothetical protein